MSILGRLIEGVRAIGRASAAAPGGRGAGTATHTASASAPRGRWIHGRYDAAQTTLDNHRHWLLADGLSADAAASPAVRRLLRNRARYEVANNSYARGIVLTLANDCVGTGARLQLTGLADADARLVERAFHDWARAVDLPERLRLMRTAQVEDGESFALLTNNPALPTPVQLDVRLIEAEQVATPWSATAETVFPDFGQGVDGIRFDRFGNPLAYHVLHRHPGSAAALGDPGYDSVPARAVIHVFRPDRPGQRRGIPELTPALTIFADLRRYSQAVIAAAETAADYAGIAYTDAPAGGEADAVEPMDTIHLEKRSLLTMPSGWRMEQMRAEQPTTTYEQFVRAKLNEAARCLNMPFNVAAGNSSGYNYASGRLDHQVYYKAIRVDQARLATQVLDRILTAWLSEARLIAGFLPDRLRGFTVDWSHQWFWDGHEHVDPAKEANAQATRLASNTTTLADEYARKGQDWEQQLRQRARELSLMRELGLELKPMDGPAAPVAPAKPGASDPADDDTDPSDPESGDPSGG